MLAASLQFVASPLPALQRVLREEHFAPPPNFPGFGARHWFVDRRTLRGRYLVTDRASAENFLRDPFAADLSIVRIAASSSVGCLETGPIEQIPVDHPIVRPVFIVSAPRTGSTLLYELLERAPELWSVGRESHGIIEGIPKLHPAYHNYRSHELSEVDADADTVHILHCGFVAELHDHRGRRLLSLLERERPCHIRMLEKTPENALRIPFLNAAFPDALFVYLVREAHQTISSMIEAWQHAGFVNIPTLPGWPHNAWHLLLPPGWQQYYDHPLSDIAAFQWAASNQAILDHLLALPRERWCAVDYQSLIAHPEATLRRLCAFLEIPFSTQLAQVLHRPLPLSGTTIRYPSPTRWRYNPDFSETALNSIAEVVQRVDEVRRDMATVIQPVQRRSAVRFRCFLDELADSVLKAPEDPTQEDGGPALVVDSSFQFQMGTTIPLPLVRRARFRERFLSDQPIAWVEDPATSTLRPFWIRYQDMWSLRGFMPGNTPPNPLTSQLQQLLVAAGILVSNTAREQRRRDGDIQAHDAAAHFAQKDYCILSGLLHPAHLHALGRYYRELIAEGAWALGDPQVAGRYGWHNEMLARFFHHQLTSYVSRAVATPVKPSYAYVSVYQGGAILERHVDREQCEFTMSLLVERSPEEGIPTWPLYFDTPDGTAEVHQSVGEAVLFRGTKLPHYRPRLADGQTYMSLLFHYVPADFSRTLY